MSRINYIDNIRGVAFILMIIQHIYYFYDVSMDYETELSHNMLVSGSGIIARTLFILLAGLSIGLSFKNKDEKDNKDNKKKIKNRIKRSLEIGLHGLLITLVTYILYPNYFVRFGILNFLALGTFIMGMISQNKIMPYIIIVICFLLREFKTSNSTILDIILGYKSKYSMMDYFPLLKWLPVMSMGVILGQNIDFENNIKTNIDLLDKPNMLTYLGKNALNLYTIHVIVFMLYYTYMNKIKL